MSTVRLTIRAADLRPRDTFERHGKVWTVEYATRGDYGSTVVVCALEGTVYLSRDDRLDVVRQTR